MYRSGCVEQYGYRMDMTCNGLPVLWTWDLDSVFDMETRGMGDVR